jgi:CheY-like chemotaxis protein
MTQARDDRALLLLDTHQLLLDTHQHGEAEGPTIPTKVLLVEDSAIVAMDLQEEARKLGISLLATIDPATAVRLVQELKPAVVLLDVNLRGGYEGLDVARAICRDTKVVIVTGYSAADLAGRMDRISDIPIYFKPIAVDDLRAVLADAKSEPSLVC